MKLPIQVLLVVAFALAASTARAEDKAALGKKRYEEGGRAMRRQAYDEAARLFESANELAPSVDKLWSIAAACLRAGRYLDARRHFTAYISDPRGPRADRFRAAREQHIPLAEAHLGRVRYLGELDLSVDETPVDRETAIAGLWVAPGTHRVRLGKADAPTEQTVDVAAGRLVEVVGPAGSQPAAVVAFPSQSAVGPSPSPAGPSPSPVGPSPAPVVPGSTRTVSVGGRTAAVLTLGAVSAIAIGGGVYAFFRATQEDRTASGLETRIGTTPCLFYASNACNDLIRAKENAAAARGFGIGAFVAGGVLLVATPITFLVWPKREVIVAPVVGGLAVRGQF